MVWRVVRGVAATLLSTTLLCPSGVAAAAEDAALSLAFSLQEERCELTSVMSLPRMPRALTPASPSWSVRAEDGASKALWRRSLPAPRAFDQAAVLPSSVVVVVPMPAPGTRLALHDAVGRERCARIVDTALLHQAEVRRGEHGGGQRGPGADASGRSQSADDEFLPGEKGAAQPSHMVSGIVTSAPEYAALRVRAYDQAGRFVHSVLETPFAFRVPAGVHRFELDPNITFRWFGDHWVYQAPVSTGPILVDRDLVLPDFAWPTQRVEVTLTVERPCGFDDTQVHLDMVAPDGRRIDRMHRQHPDLPPLVRPPGQCASEHLLWLSPGDYTIDVAPLGWAPQRLELALDAVSPPTQRVLAFMAAERTAVWQGTLLDASQRPVPGAGLRVHNADQLQLWTGSSQSDGRFLAPFRPGWSIELTPPTSAIDGGSVRSLLRYGSAPPATPWRLEHIDLAPTADSGLLRIFGDGDRRRLDLLFVAEGYTGVAETYSDLDGNGLWDGVVWYDLNADGVYDYSDRVVVRGDAAFPQPGSDPTAANEPFVDLNADGLLSLDDSALFRANVVAFLRSLFGSDVWAEHRHSFNAYLLFEPSAQAGHDVYDYDGRLRVQRDTRYAARASSILTMDTDLLAERALLALPDVDVAVGLIQQPIPMGGAFAIQNQPGLMVVGSGPAGIALDDTLPSHEMAHLVAGLCDEYTIFSGAHVLPAPDLDVGCANATVQVDAARLPWAQMLPTPPRPFPSRDGDGSIGLYEGADKFSSGRYRPTRNSTMRGNFPYFNLPSRHALVDGLDRYARLFGSGFEE